MKRSLILVLLAVTSISCSTQRKLEMVRRSPGSASLMLPGNDILPTVPKELGPALKDTLKVLGDDGRELIIMKAIKDDDGEMVANETIDAAVVTARFRNVAERNGEVDLRFLITVPATMLDSKWQMRMTPRMTVLDDVMALDPVVITGKDYRRAQLRGYQQYERFLNSIVTDTTKFIRKHELEVFLHRNLPEIYQLKTDSTFVSDEAFKSLYGVTQRQAVQHYTDMIAVSWNRRKIDMKDRMFDKLVKVPIITEGLRLDTVMTGNNGDFIYEYVQTIRTVPKLKKVDIALSGGIYEEDKGLYDIPEGSPVTFYISSISSLCIDKERFLSKVVGRRVSANSTYWIDFDQGHSEINPGLGSNANEIGRIKTHLGAIMEDEEFDLDSIIVTASCSPEGSWNSNDALSQRRSMAVSEYFSRFCRHYLDSAIRDKGVFIDLDGRESGSKYQDIRFISKNVAENWDMLRDIVHEDYTLSERDKEDISSKFMIEDADIREKALSKEAYYSHLLQNVYPKLRTVRFDFHLHRKGMVKDTVHTTVLDSTYMEGLAALKEMDYKQAVTLLRPYRDFNSAIAFCCMGYNESALSVLDEIEETAETDYLKAIIYSRKGMIQEAVQHYMDACRKEPSFVHRGNLDPEISQLIKEFNLNEL